jgi:hypothetical protein
MRVYNDSYHEPDLEIPDDFLISKVRDSNCWMLYCLTMYNENFGQIMQSLVGCIRSIMELRQLNPVKYSPKKFGIVLVMDGFDKFNPDVLDKLIDIGAIDAEHWCDTLLTTKSNKKEHVKRTYTKKETLLENDDDDSRLRLRMPYATQNVAHIFSKVLKDEDLKEILNL